MIVVAKLLFENRRVEIAQTLVNFHLRRQIVSLISNCLSNFYKSMIWKIMKNLKYYFFQKFSHNLLEKSGFKSD